jgi:hypothetical protein
MLPCLLATRRKFAVISFEGNTPAVLTAAHNLMKDNKLVYEKCEPLGKTIQAPHNIDPFCAGGVKLGGHNSYDTIK